MAVMQNGTGGRNWWLMEMLDGGRFIVQSDARPQEWRRIVCNDGSQYPLSLAAGSYKVVAGPYTEEHAQQWINRTAHVGRVMVTPRIGWVVKTIVGHGAITEIKDGKVRVGSIWFAAEECEVLDMGLKTGDE